MHKFVCTTCKFRITYVLVVLLLSCWAAQVVFLPSVMKWCVIISSSPHGLCLFRSKLFSKRLPTAACVALIIRVQCDASTWVEIYCCVCSCRLLHDVLMLPTDGSLGDSTFVTRWNENTTVSFLTTFLFRGASRPLDDFCKFCSYSSGFFALYVSLACVSLIPIQKVLEASKKDVINHLIHLDPSPHRILDLA